MQFRIEYANGKKIIVEGKNALEIIRRFDLCTRENIKTKVFQLAEQKGQ